MLKPLVRHISAVGDKGYGGQSRRKSGHVTKPGTLGAWTA